MRILLDTHILLWVISNPERLSASIRATILDPTNDVLFSAASIWEIAIKRAQGKLNAPENLLDERLLGHVQPVRRARKSTSAPAAPRARAAARPLQTAAVSAPPADPPIGARPCPPQVTSGSCRVSVW